MPNLLTYTDKELLALIAGGDESAFREIVLRYKGKLYTVVRMMTRSPEMTQEIVQDSFLQVWLTREGLTEVENFDAYLFILCRNQTLNALRKTLRAEEKRRYLQATMPRDEWAEIPVSDDALVRLVEQAVAQLPPKQQLAWQLSRREGLKYNEIAAQMNVSTETVKTHIKLASASIIAYLKARKELLIWIAALFAD